MTRWYRFGMMSLALAFVLALGCKSEQPQAPAEQKEEAKKAEPAAPAKAEPGKDEKKSEVAPAPAEAPKQPEAPKSAEPAAAPAEGAPAALAAGTRPLAADVLPSDVAAVFATFGAEEWMKLLAEIGVTKERMLKSDPDFQEALDALGVDPLTADGLKALGLDMNRSPALAFIPGTDVDALGVFAIPMAAGKSGVALVKDVMAKRKPKEDVVVSSEESKVGDTLVLWMTKERGTEKELAAVMDLGGYLVLVLALEHGADTESGRAQVRTLATRIADVKTERLASVPGFEEATAGLDKAVATIFVTAKGLIPLMMRERDTAILVPLMASFDAGVLWAEEKDNNARMGMRVVMKEATSYFTKRDTAVRNIVPVEPLLGFHAAGDSTKLIPMLEGMIQSNKDVAEGYAKGWSEALKAMGLPEGTRIQDLWSGELGFFMGTLAKDEQVMMKSMVGFLGVANEALLSQAIEGSIKASGASPMVQREVIGQATTWRVKVPPVDAGMALLGKRLWIAGDFSLIQAVVAGEGKLAKTERGQQVTAVMATESPKVFYIDLQRFMLSLLPLIGSGSQDDLMVAMPLITELNLGSVAVEEKGKAVTALVDVTMNSSVRGTFVKLLQQAVNREFERSPKKEEKAVEAREAAQP